MPLHQRPPLLLHRTRRAAALTAALIATAALTAACGGGSPRTPEPGPAGPQSTGAAADTPRGFTLVATGDLLIHDSVIRQARADAGGSGHDFGPMLAGARDTVAGADLAICHMETVYGPEGGPFTGYPAFRTPPQLAEAVRETGYDSCSTASNHTLDAGAEGVIRTLDAMDRAGLAHAGSARSATERDTPVLLTAGDARVAQLAYAYGTNGIPVPEDQPWLVNLIDPERIVADARAARAAGADVVVVSMHWGTEWQEEPDSLQLSLARELTASASGGRPDIDLIIGTHAHVPQAYEKVNGTWVVYGMGDQLAGVMSDPRGQLGSAARFTFAPPAGEDGRWTVERAEYIPFVVDNDPIRVVSLPEALAADPDDAGRSATLDRIGRAVLGRGAAEDGLTLGR
ncbi:CapA family protein [Streptomyces aidingensis]|uniref:Poly-gamma-glutamate synthesis protein (Capsule biosynthesis protein) n=1 Tax=Streptomyces aidingensis TaxID=910347 RepID=A0A1I1N8P2_9ACTN|nr:poly-gamma-glutamate synthesis protein (capsule biosynthesis protein) [Streptomyces aidingensis]